MTTKKVGLIAATVAAAVLPAAGCSSDDGDSATTTTSPPDSDTTQVQASGQVTAELVTVEEPDEIRNYVGAIEGTDIYAAFAITEDDGESTGMAYFCDGDQVSTWLNLSKESDVSDGTVAYRSPSGATFDGTVTDEELTGTVVLPDGTTHEVTAAAVEPDGEAGLYLADYIIDSDLADDERAGWIVLPDGSQRGAIRGGNTLLPGTNMNVTSGAVTVAGRNILLTQINQIIGLDASS